MVSSETYVIASIILAVMPAMVLLTYYAGKDKGEKEPKPLMRKAFFWGILAIIPVIIAEFLLFKGFALITQNTYLIAFVTPFILIALPEELAKFAVVKRIAYNHPKFNEVMDGITYTILASMGFAVFENLSYTYQYGMDIALMRSITAVPAHALFSGIMGYYIGYAKFIPDKKKSRNTLIKGLIAGIFLHGLYDFLVMSGISALVLMVFPLLLYMWYVLDKGIRLAHKDKPVPLKYI